MKNSFTSLQTKTAFLNLIALGVSLCLSLNIKSQSNVCWTTQAGNIGNSAIFSCSSNTTLLNADTLIIKHSVTIGSSNNQVVNYASADFSIISLENNATLSPFGSNNILRLPPFAEIKDQVK
ncbi:MAG: hypothetical protein Q8K70_10480 [Bacteroidota bacterium]|nr:hypothetical protein [Bacteroidota bacterium]